MNLPFARKTSLQSPGLTNPPSTPVSLLGGVRYILRLWLRHWPQALLLVLVLLVYESFKTFFSLSVREIINSLQATGRVQNFGATIGLIFLAFLVAFGARLLGERVIAQVGAKLLNYLRMTMFKQLQRLSQSYFARTPIGDITARFSSDLAMMERGLTLQLRDSILDGMEIIMNVPVLFYLDWRLGSLAMLSIVLLTFVLGWLAPRATQAGYQHKTTEAQIINEIQENTRAQALIRAFGFEPLMLARFERSLAGVETTGFKALFRRTTVTLAAKAMLALSRIVTVGAGVFLVMQGAMTIGDLVAFLSLLEIVNLAVDDFSRGVLPDLITATSSIQRIEDLLQQAPDTIDRVDAVAIPRLAREIQLKDLCFSYTGQEKNLAQVNMTIPAGQSVAFVGPSGSGKSTLLSLLIRAHTPSSGTIAFDGVDISAATRASLQKQMGVVFQDTYLFNTTIRENIRMAKPDASDAMVEEAAKMAEIHDLIVRLPHQYDTSVGEAGGWLSGGQRQRIAIARAIIRDPAILILDEATSALDPGTEAAINATLQRVAQSRTVIAVTHRLSSVVHADAIFVLDHGHLVESGPHQALLQQQGLYADLWKKQSGFEVSNDGRTATVHPAYLQRIALFADLDEDTRTSLAERFSAEYMDKGQIIFRQGDIGERLYLIARGQVEVLVRNAQGEVQDEAQGEEQIIDEQIIDEQIIDVMGDGDHFGEMALLENAPRNATIRTVTGCLFLTLPKQEFLLLLEERPEVRAIVNSQIERTRLNRLRLNVEGA